MLVRLERPRTIATTGTRKGGSKGKRGLQRTDEWEAGPDAETEATDSVSSDFDEEEDDEGRRKRKGKGKGKGKGKNKGKGGKNKPAGDTEPSTESTKSKKPAAARKAKRLPPITQMGIFPSHVWDDEEAGDKPPGALVGQTLSEKARAELAQAIGSTADLLPQLRFEGQPATPEQCRDALCMACLRPGSTAHPLLPCDGPCRRFLPLVSLFPNP
jgi:hypothetical protein